MSEPVPKREMTASSGYEFTRFWQDSALPASRCPILEEQFQPRSLADRWAKEKSNSNFPKN
jgi:hypothetical protein